MLRAVVLAALLFAIPFTATASPCDSPPGTHGCLAVLQLDDTGPAPVCVVDADPAPRVAVELGLSRTASLEPVTVQPSHPSESPPDGERLALGLSSDFGARPRTVSVSPGAPPEAPRLIVRGARGFVAFDDKPPERYAARHV